MEDHIWRRTSQLAAVVRDFAPSRLERQLLAQAFELAWNRSPSIEPSERAGVAGASSHLDGRSSATQIMIFQAARR